MIAWLFASLLAHAGVHDELQRALGPEGGVRAERHLDDRATELTRALQVVAPVQRAEVRDLLDAAVLERLAAYQDADLVLDEEIVHRRIIDFEAFKAESYVLSGVYPRRYFGFVDGRGDTAMLELRLVETAQISAEVCNRWLQEQDIPWRVTEQEIALTWISEGGALLLSDGARHAEDVHPVLGVGLDDIHHGFQEHAELVEGLDGRLGTDLADIPVWQGPDRYLSRNMTFAESIAGTAIMWVWEKAIAQAKLVEAGRKPLQSRPLADQFVLSSLVYNSGLIHAPQRSGQVQRYELASHLAALAHRFNGRRAHLPVEPSATTLARLLATRTYPYQGTSWIALYHIAQRYGGYDALSRYSDVFTKDGTFRAAPWRARRAMVQASRAAVLSAHHRHLARSFEGTPRPQWCATTPLTGLPWLPLLALFGLLRRTRAPRTS